jgi:lipoprotein signal peptidase
MSVTASAALGQRRLGVVRFPWWISMLGVATAGAVADVALKLWAVSQLSYLRETPSLFGVDLVLDFNRRPSFDFEHFVIGQALMVMIKYLTLGYLGWRLKGWWRWLGLGLILGGAMANVGNWLLTHAVVDFLVMPWATVNLADLLIVIGAAVIVAGWSTRLLSHLNRRTRPVVSENPATHDSHTTPERSQPLKSGSKTAIRLPPSPTSPSLRGLSGASSSRDGRLVGGRCPFRVAPHGDDWARVTEYVEVRI